MDPFIESLQRIRGVSEAISFLQSQCPAFSDRTKRALAFAQKAHEGQFRKSGEPYIVHPILVASVTAWISGDETMVQAALLHDTLEDTSATIEDIEADFGEDVAHLVEGMTKIVAIRDEKLLPSGSDTRLIQSALSFRKMLIASIKDVRVLVIKLCDRLHNMLTLDALHPSKQRRIAEETLVVYAPIAHRLGIAKIKNLLEDLSFRYIYPKEYASILAYFQDNEALVQTKLNAFMEKVTRLMQYHGFYKRDFEVVGRIKHYYSIYLKMQRKGIGIDEVLDLLAIRVIVKEPLECYRVLGLLHTNFTPLISRFKDYIAIPKENGYQTIHTTVFDEVGIIEVQIRTQAMHRLAEYGIAAHWKYKEGEANVNLEWLESLNYQNDSVEEFYELAKSDLFSEEITVFSPKGDTYTLPKDATALDFAYAVHSAIGDTAKSAIVNKQEVSLLTVLKNGDIVKIVRDTKPILHCSWIDALKTSKAKAGIRTMCRERLQRLNRQSVLNIIATMFPYTHEEIGEALKGLGYDESLHKSAQNLDYLKEILHALSHYFRKKHNRFWKRLKAPWRKPKIKTQQLFMFFTNKPLGGVEFDYCCHPKGGDAIVAFYKDSKAIIHHKLCKHAYELIESKEPMVYVEWKAPKTARYRLIIGLQNKPGVLAQLLTKLSALKLNVLSIELGIKQSETAEFCRIEVESPIYKPSQLRQKLEGKFKLIEIVNLDDAYEARR